MKCSGHTLSQVSLDPSPSPFIRFLDFSSIYTLSPSRTCPKVSNSAFSFCPNISSFFTHCTVIRRIQNNQWLHVSCLTVQPSRSTLHTNITTVCRTYAKVQICILLMEEFFRLSSVEKGVQTCQVMQHKE